jgi:hypothetical protein
METLTREAIEAMPAGPELDALVATQVLGWTFSKSSFEQYEPSEWRKDGRVVWGASFRPSTDIAAAWLLLPGRGWIIQEDTYVSVGRWEVYDNARDFEDGIWMATAPTPALALCRAALLATPVSPAPAVPASV